MQDGCDEEKEGAPNGIFVCHVGRIDWGAFASNFVLAPTSKKDKVVRSGWEVATLENFRKWPQAKFEVNDPSLGYELSRHFEK